MPALVILALAWPRPRWPSRGKPVYVGAKVCARCHDGPAMGHQTTHLAGHRHARAYASLAAPEARAIAAISGVPDRAAELAALPRAATPPRPTPRTGRRTTRSRCATASRARSATGRGASTSSSILGSEPGHDTPPAA